MSIRNKLTEQPTINEEVVSHGENQYRVVGSPDANLMAETVLLTPDKVKLFAEHWKLFTGHNIDESMVKNIALVHRTLQPGYFENGDWVDEPQYDVTEIAKLSQQQGPLFLMLMAAAYKVLGLVENPHDPEDNTLSKVIVGNSPEPEATS
jgi:hypothetical protein